MGTEVLEVRRERGEGREDTEEREEKGAKTAARSLPYAAGVRVREDGTSEAASGAQAQ